MSVLRRCTARAALVLVAPMLASCATPEPAHQEQTEDVASAALPDDPLTADDESALLTEPIDPASPLPEDTPETFVVEQTLAGDFRPRPANKEERRVVQPERDPVTGRSVTGRPSWWYPEIRRSKGAVSLCAEALGPDMQHAVLDAVNRALARVDQQSIKSADQLADLAPRVHAVNLPHAGLADNRFAAYVELTLPTPH